MSKTLLLVDGSSYLYRAFHALPDMRSPAGEPVNAIFGVLNMLRRLQMDISADYSACVFDAKGKTFRDEWYPDYKANRPAMPADLACQIAPLLEAIRALGWPLLSVEGVEADDVIGTLAKQAGASGIATVISTGDKDMAQLVDAHVSLVNTMTAEKLDEASVQAKFGVPPERIVDYLSLVGDAVDNVPGVAKVGPKTAVKWIAQYGCLDAIMDHANEITGAVGDNLRTALDWLPMARKLITIRTDLSLDVMIESLAMRPRDVPALVQLFERFQFRTWLREVQAVDHGLGKGSHTAQPVSSEKHYRVLTALTDLDAYLEEISHADLVSLDTETTGLEPMHSVLVGMSFAVEPHRAAYLPLAHRGPDMGQQVDRSAALAQLKHWLEDGARAKVGQNLKFDMHILANHGITLRGVMHDTLLQAYLLESHLPRNMDSLAARHLGVPVISYEDVTGKGATQIGFDQVEIARAAVYAAEDADITLQLHQKLYPQLMQDKGLTFVYHQIEIPLLPVLWQMERTGVLIDCIKLQAQSNELAKSLHELEQQAMALAGQPFNLNSPKQIQAILFDQLKLPVVKKTASGVPSTDEEVLATLAEDYPLPKVLLEYRGLAKLKSTYTDKLPKMLNPHTGRVHTSYSQAVAVTGRLSSVEPNLQNIPVKTAQGRRIREAFIAAPGYVLVSLDYSQIELRIMAHLSGDENLLRAFAEDQDVHSATAAEIFGIAASEVMSDQRRVAKTINFGLIYGMSAFGLARALGLERNAAQAYIDRYFSRYPGVAAYMQSTRELARQQGYVKTVFGRRLWLPEINSPNRQRRDAAERAAINAPMQGTAADLIKLAMVACANWLIQDNLRSRLIMQVHDELVLEVHEAELETVRNKLPELMCHVANLRVPLKVSFGVGANWDAAH